MRNGNRSGYFPQHSFSCLFPKSKFPLSFSEGISGNERLGPPNQLGAATSAAPPKALAQISSAPESAGAAGAAAELELAEELDELEAAAGAAGLAGDFSVFGSLNRSLDG